MIARTKMANTGATLTNIGQLGSEWARFRPHLHELAQRWPVEYGIGRVPLTCLPNLPDIGPSLDEFGTNFGRVLCTSGRIQAKCGRLQLIGNVPPHAFHRGSPRIIALHGASCRMSLDTLHNASCEMSECDAVAAHPTAAIPIGEKAGNAPQSPDLDENLSEPSRCGPLGPPGLRRFEYFGNSERNTRKWLNWTLRASTICHSYHKQI